MTRKLKALGLAMIAVFAMGALAAQGAQAATPGTLTASSYPAPLTGHSTGIHKFELKALGLSTECETAKFTGELTAASPTITVTPVYEKCKAFGLASTIDHEGCQYLIHITETLPSSTTYDGDIDVVCPAGQVIKITAGIIGNKCEVQVGGQTGLTTLTGNNTPAAGGNPDDVDLTAHVTGITYKVTKDEGTCPLSKVGETFKDGVYSGQVTVTANPIGLTLSD